MAAAIAETFQWWFSRENSPMAQHMRDSIEAAGRTVEDVSEMSINHFIYKGKPEGEWMTYEPTHVGFYELTFADKTSINQFWHWGNRGPVSLEQVKDELDMERLLLQDRKFIEEYKPS